MSRRGRSAQGGAPLPPPTLQMHLFHLASQVSMALGELENPITGEKELDLRVARYLIDTLAMLDEKTRGNRTPDEDQYVSGLLANLRMAFVAKADEPPDVDEPEDDDDDESDDQSEVDDEDEAAGGRSAGG